MPANKDKESRSAKSAASAESGRMRALIEKQPFFKGLSDSQYDILASLAIEKDFKTGACIFREGDPANRFYLILEGGVELNYECPDHSGPCGNVLGAGEDLGWTWMFPPYYFSATAVALEPTKTIFFYGTRLRQECEQDHDLGYELMKRVAQVAIQHLSTARKDGAKARPTKSKR